MAAATEKKGPTKMARPKGIQETTLAADKEPNIMPTPKQAKVIPTWLALMPKDLMA